MTDERRRTTDEGGSDSNCHCEELDFSRHCEEPKATKQSLKMSFRATDDSGAACPERSRRALAQDDGSCKVRADKVSRSCSGGNFKRVKTYNAVNRHTLPPGSQRLQG